jgi:hypothetical protein
MFEILSVVSSDVSRRFYFRNIEHISNIEYRLRVMMPKEFKFKFSHIHTLLSSYDQFPEKKYLSSFQLNNNNKYSILKKRAEHAYYMCFQTFMHVSINWIRQMFKILSTETWSKILFARISHFYHHEMLLFFRETNNMLHI